MMRRKRAADWRAPVDKPAGSGLNAAAFCRCPKVGPRAWRRSGAKGGEYERVIQRGEKGSV